MEENDMGCLYGFDQIIDENGELVKRRMEKRHYTGRVRRIPKDHAFYKARGRGCCMCAHRRVIDKYIEIGLKEDEHDEQCPRIAALFDTLWELDRPVISYRIYENNTSGISADFTYGKGILPDRIEDIKRVLYWLHTVRKTEALDAVQSKLVGEAYDFLLRRRDYLSQKRGHFSSMLPFVFNYPNLDMLVGDVAYKHGLNNALGKIRWGLRK